MRSIRISIPLQQLDLLDAQSQVLRSYPVSTAKNGPGEANGSNCTPRGRHLIHACIGAGLPECTIFVAREPVGLWTPELAAADPDKDYILSRILWLTGCEAGFNQGGDVDSCSRYIYIHGTPDTQPMGEPRSHGCIRMRNPDVIDLFERVERGTAVEILG